MFQTFAVIQVIVSVLLIIVILLQEGKKGMGSVFGGSSGSVFGARGAGNLLTKVTSVLAFLFMLNSVWLAHLSSDRGSIVQTAGEVGIQSAEEEKEQPVTGSVPVAPAPQKAVTPVEKKEDVAEKKAPVAPVKTDAVEKKDAPAPQKVEEKKAAPTQKPEADKK